DGFIWKVRHRENHETLGAVRGNASTQTASWWTHGRHSTAVAAFARQLLYFGVPVAVLTVGASSVWNAAPRSSIALMYEAQAASQQGELQEASAAAKSAYAEMAAELPLLRKLQALDGTPSRTAELAYLVYNHSHYRYIVLPALEGRQVTLAQRDKHRVNVARAVDLLESALAHGQVLGHPGREQLTRADAEAALDAWRRIAFPGDPS
ncbi:MAG: hypothetical protein ABW110_00290, partial [Steroidobacteraceae bacterium]